MESQLRLSSFEAILSPDGNSLVICGLQSDDALDAFVYELQLLPLRLVQKVNGIKTMTVFD
jgi:hypothetical protein